MVDQNIIPVFGILFGIGGPVCVVIVWIVLLYRKRRRLLELNHVERMAAIERGMDVPPLPIDDGSPRRRRSSLLPGLVWFFVGLALLIGAILSSEDDLTIFALVPLGVGVAYLIYYFVEGRALEARLLEQDIADRSNAALNGRGSAPSNDFAKRLP